MTLIEIPVRTTEGRHTIVPHLTIEWLHGGQVLVYTMTSSEESVLDAYFQINFQLMDEAEATPQDLFLVAHDLSHPDVNLTPYFRKRLNEVAERIKQGTVQYRSAVILEENISGMVLKFFGNRFTKNAKNTIQPFFTDRDKALAWVEQYVKS